jgi:hypothetical protein
MGIFGWSYPPGAANDPNAPYNQTDQPCEVCGKFPDNCICPECPNCGAYGDPHCYDNHGLVRTEAQTCSYAEYEEQQRQEQEYYDRYVEELEEEEELASRYKNDAPTEDEIKRAQQTMEDLLGKEWLEDQSKRGETQ